MVVGENVLWVLTSNFRCSKAFSLHTREMFVSKASEHLFFSLVRCDCHQQQTFIQHQLHVRRGPVPLLIIDLPYSQSYGVEILTPVLYRQSELTLCSGPFPPKTSQQRGPLQEC